MPQITTRQPAPTPVTDQIPLPPRLLPDLPPEVLERFPQLVDWETGGRRGWSRAYQALQNSNRDVSQNITREQTEARSFRAAYNEFVAEITEEVEVIADEQGAQAKRIVTVSAMAGINSGIVVQATPPGAPALNSYWINTADPLNPVTYQWDGADFVEVTTPISFAGVADERTARVTADGFLEGKFTLNVIAGDVITGVNITSASGPGTNISNVAWTSDQFLIQGSTTKRQMFYADAGQDVVRLANLFTVDGANDRLYAKTTAGAGAFNSAGTPIYFDILAGVGRMSLGTRLTWDGSNLAINGTITATAGIIGGWTIGTTTLSGGNAILDSAGQLVLGTANDVVYVSANDATYRLWVGNITAGSAAFSVTKAGALFSNSGTIAGFTINPTGFTVGSGSSFVQIQSTGATIQFGQGSNYVSVFGSTGMVFTNSGGIGTLGGFLGSIGGNNYLRVYNNSSTLQFEVDASTGTVKGPSGSTSAPGFAFNADPDTGWRWNSSGDMRAVTNGSDRLVVRDGAIVCLVPLKLDNSRVAGAPVAGGTVTMQDLSGATVQVLVV